MHSDPAITVCASTLETETTELGVEGQSRVHSKTSSQKERRKKCLLIVFIPGCRCWGGQRIEKKAKTTSKSVNKGMDG